MPLVIGVDEAGYGPNLGPLVVGLTMWEAQASDLRRDWYARLKRAVCRTPPRASNGTTNVNNGSPLAIADSKLLYDTATGVKWLERAVLSSWEATRSDPTTESLVGRDWRAAWGELDPSSVEVLANCRFHATHQQPVPAACDPRDIQGTQALLTSEFERSGIRLVMLQARGVFPAQFNRAVQQFENKAQLLSLTTFRLIRDALERHPEPNVLVYCDKHGGRNNYAALLQHVFPDPPIEVRFESAEVSKYRWRDGGRTVEVELRAGGETQLAVALASMTAKYLRELSMAAFNAFWQRAIPGLKSTAGYSTDARRFKQDIARRQAELGIDDEILWRIK